MVGGGGEVHTNVNPSLQLSGCLRSMLETFFGSGKVRSTVLLTVRTGRPETATRWGGGPHEAVEVCPFANRTWFDKWHGMAFGVSEDQNLP